MPIHLSPLAASDSRSAPSPADVPNTSAPHRRRFLQQLAVGAGALVAGQSLWPRQCAAAGKATDPHLFALFSDTHISQNPREIVRNVSMFEHLTQARQEVLALDSLPAAALVDGDCAYLKGEPGDYHVFVEQLAGLRKAGLPVHMTLGNHDEREHFWEGVLAGQPRELFVDARHVSIVSTPRADWFLLDSLDKTNVTPGTLGEAQIEWLAKALDQRAAAAGDAPLKPVIVLAHHNPVSVIGASMGLTDTDALFRVLGPRKQVKAFIFGHTHHWGVSKRQGIHLVNLPSVAYPFNSDDPTGWVRCHLEEQGAVLELHSTDPKHRAHGQQVKLAWREA